MRQRPFGIAGAWHGVPVRVRAPQQRDCMGLFREYFSGASAPVARA